MKIHPSRHTSFPHSSEDLSLKGKLLPLGVSVFACATSYPLFKHLLSETQSENWSTSWKSPTASFFLGLGVFYISSKIKKMLASSSLFSKVEELKPIQDQISLSPKSDEKTPIKDEKAASPILTSTHQTEFNLSPTHLKHQRSPIDEHFRELNNIYAENPFTLHSIVSLKKLNELPLKKSVRELLNILFEPYSPQNERRVINLLEAKPSLLSKGVDIPGEGNFRLTPLIAAILNNQLEYTKKILEFTNNINAEDNQKYTAAHYAAIVANPDILKLLEERGANFEQVNAYGTTPLDILDIYCEAYCKKLKFLIYPFKKGPGFDRKFYLQRFHSEYLPCTIFSPQSLLGVRVTGPSHSWCPEILRQYVREQFEEMRKTDEIVPKIYIQSLERKDDETPIPEFLKGQLEVRARKDIAPGEIIGEYTGYHSHIQTNSKFPYGDKSLGNACNGYIHAERGGNFMSLINHGPPNSASVTHFYRGLPHQVIIALRPIKKDEPIYLDYGKIYFKHKVVEELSPKTLQEYYEKTKNFTNFEHFFVVDSQKIDPQKVVNVHLNDNGKYVICEKQIDPDQLMEVTLQSLHHRKMLDYVLTYTQRSKYQEKIKALLDSFYEP